MHMRAGVSCLFVMIGAMIVCSTKVLCFAMNLAESGTQMPPEPTFSTPTVKLPVMLVAEVQDSLLVVVHDLNRLDGLLVHAMEKLMQRF